MYIIIVCAENILQTFIKDGAYFCYRAHLLRITQFIDRTRPVVVGDPTRRVSEGNLLAQNDEFNFATKRATKMQENFGCNEIQLMDVLNQEQRKSNISVSPKRLLIKMAHI